MTQEMNSCQSIILISLSKMVIEDSRMTSFDVIIWTFSQGEGHRWHGNVIKNKHWPLAALQFATNSTLKSSGFCYHDLHSECN